MTEASVVVLSALILLERFDRRLGRAYSLWKTVWWGREQALHFNWDLQSRDIWSPPRQLKHKRLPFTKGQRSWMGLRKNFQHFESVWLLKLQEGQTCLGFWQCFSSTALDRKTPVLTLVSFLGHDWLYLAGCDKAWPKSEFARSAASSTKDNNCVNVTA